MKYIPLISLWFLCILSIQFSFAQKDNFLDTFPVSVHCDECLLSDVFVRLKNQHNINFFYQPGDSILQHKLKIDLENASFKNALSEMFNGTNYSYIFYPPKNIIVVPESKTPISNLLQEGSNRTIQIGNILERGKNRSSVLSGTIKDGKTGQSVSGAVIYSIEANRGAVSDGKGSYSIELPTGKQSVEYSIVGFEKGIREIELISNGSLDVDLFEESIKLDEVTVSRKRVDKNVSQAQMSTIELSAKEILNIPSLMGETDIIKSMTLMPGVQTVGEAATGFNIRGGNVDQNLILVEEVPIFNTSHLFGFFSTIHPGAVSDVTLYKGNIPANYGGRISSVMDIGIKDGSMDKFSVDGGIGLINARLTVETPVVKEKISVLVAARSTYSDWILQRIPDISLRESEAGYYDLLAKMRYRINVKNTVSVFGYKSSDNFNLANTSLYEYGNQLAGFKYNHVFNSRFYFTLSASSSEYNLHVSSEKYEGDPTAFDMKSGIFQNGAKINFTIIPHLKHTVTTGAEINSTLLYPGERVPSSENSIVLPVKIKEEKGREYGFYINDLFEITSRITLNAGFRYSMYACLGEKSVFQYQPGISLSEETITDTFHFGNNETIKKYITPEPRVSLKFSVDDNSSIKIGYTRNAQYIQLMSNTAAATPTDVWKLSDGYVKPLLSNQYSVGYFRNFAGNTIETSIETYYKDIKNLIDYKNGAVVIMNEHIETDILPGNGKTYGIEFMLKKNSGKLTGWLGYTYSRSYRKTESNFVGENINHGEYYPASYDKPHDVTTTLLYQISRKWSISGNFIYNTGRPVTLPEYTFIVGDKEMVYFSDRNKYRLPDYHRLDLSITYHGHIKADRRYKSSWSLSVFNVYGRDNPFSVYYTKDQPTAANDYKEYVLYKLSVVSKPIPTITYNFKF